MVFEDRISKYPGRWTLIKTDGTSEIVTLVRNDEPVTEGTPINASTLNELSTVAGALNAAEEAKKSASQSTVSATSAAASQTAAASSASAAKASEEAAAKSASDAKSVVSVDVTLSVSGAPADAKTTGDRLANVYSKDEADAKFGTPYTLPAATTSTLGGVKVGDYLDIAADGTISGKTLYDTIAASVAVKADARLVWNANVKSSDRWKTYDTSIPDGVDYVKIQTKCNGYTSAEVELARGGTTSHAFNKSTGYVYCTVTFQADGTLHVVAPYNSNYSYAIELEIAGYHYPTLAELLTETQAAQADTDALMVDQEYRVTLLELGLDDDSSSDTETT